MPFYCAARDKKHLRSLLLGSVLVLGVCAEPSAHTALQVGSQTIRVEYAATPEALRHGLMNRSTLAADHGMLFELGSADIHCFWMKDTLLPLSIAFIDAQGKIVDIQAMAPLDLSPHCPPVPITQALEMNRGWFEHRQIKVGDTVRPADP